MITIFKKLDSRVSYRRWLLNNCLSRYFKNFKNIKIAVDIGGNKLIGKKKFSFPVDKVDLWINLNINEKLMPEIVGDASKIPIRDKSVDLVILTEVLEHLTLPAQSINEIYRIIKPGGEFIGSAPFIFPIHGDPDDYYRFTDSALKLMLKKFKTVEIEPMGGLFGVIALMIEQGIPSLSTNRLVKFFLRHLSIILCKFDIANNYKGSNRFTTGWFWKCKK